MFDILFNVVAFIVALGVLITFHEYGHYWVARKAGVKVLRFSVGFGKPLWRRVGGVDNTEYVIAAIPLGGYVKMLDEREGDVPPEERQRAFNTQSVYKRIAIVAAGPIANFLLAIATYWLMFLIGISGIVPLVGEIQTDTVAARAGFVEEDRITAVDGKDVQSWDEVRFSVLDSSLGSDEVPVVFTVEERDGLPAQRIIAEDFSALLKQDGDPLQNLGLTYWLPTFEPVIAQLQPDGPAELAGVEVGDRVLAFDKEPIDDWNDLVRLVQAHPQETIVLTVDRDGVAQDISIVTAERMLQGQRRGLIGAVGQGPSVESREKMQTTTRYGLVDGLVNAVQRTWEMSSLTLTMLGKLITGQAALSNISGPVTIAQYAGQSAAIGFDHYLNFIAIISISLGILNLLPIPMLDGGHLLYFSIEWIKGSPVSESVQLFGQQLGIVLLGGLMCLAFYNDFWRLMQ